MIASVAVKHKVNSDLVFDYYFSPNTKLQLYSVVEVNFSGKKTLAVVINIKSSSSKARKEIIKVISQGPVFTKDQIDLAKKISDYFIAPLGPTLFSFFPNFSKKEIGDIKSNQLFSAHSHSGKSELLIMEFDQRLQYYFQKLKSNTQNIILLPSIYKIEQTRKKIKEIFPHLPIYIWHSKISAREKSIVYQKCLCNEELTIIGSRDTLFLPFRNLKNIYIDKPSSYSYFEDQIPRYNAFCVARLLKALFQSNLFVGESIPSIISYLSYKKGLLSINQTKFRRRFDLYDNFTREMQNPSVQDRVRHTLLTSSNILVVGPFKNKLRAFCRECKSDITCYKCTGAFFSDKYRCISCGEAGPTTCFSCKSQRITLAGFTKKSVLEALLTKDEKTKLSFADLDEIDNLPPIFDYILVPYFDSMYEFAFVGYKEKLMESMCSLSRIALKKILIFSDKYKKVLVQLESGNWEDFIKTQLKERKKENLPPFTKAIKLVLKYNYPKSIKLISEISKNLTLGDPVFTTGKKKNWVESLFLIKHSRFAQIKKGCKQYISSKLYFMVDPVDFGV